MNKLGRALLAAAIVSSLAVTPVFAEPTVDELESGKAAVENEVSSLQAELTELLDKLGQLEEDLIAKGQEITKAGEDLKAAEEKQQEQYEAMKLRIKYMYENGDITAIETLVSAKDFSDLVNKAEYVQNVHSYDRKKLKEYIEIKDEVTKMKSKLESEQAALESMQEEYEAEEQTLNATLESKRAEIADFDQQIQAAAEAAAAEAAARAAEAEAEANRNHAASENESNDTSDQNNNNVNNNINHANTDNTDNQLGVPYVWGGTTPYGGLDCSGLVQYCHRVAGISLPRTSQAQGGGGIAVSNPQPGDVVCYGTHIGIYIGNSQMIHAPKPGDVVKVAKVYGSPWYRRYW